MISSEDASAFDDLKLYPHMRHPPDSRHQEHPEVDNIIVRHLTLLPSIRSSSDHTEKGPRESFFFTSIPEDSEMIYIIHLSVFVAKLFYSVNHAWDDGTR